MLARGLGTFPFVSPVLDRAGRIHTLSNTDYVVLGRANQAVKTIAPPSREQQHGGSARDPAARDPITRAVGSVAGHLPEAEMAGDLSRRPSRLDP